MCHESAKRWGWFAASSGGPRFDLNEDKRNTFIIPNASAKRQDWIVYYQDNVSLYRFSFDFRVNGWSQRGGIALSLLESVQRVANTDKEVRRMKKNKKQRVTSSFSHLRTADKSRCLVAVIAGCSRHKCEVIKVWKKLFSTIQQFTQWWMKHILNVNLRPTWMLKTSYM